MPRNLFQDCVSDLLDCAKSNSGMGEEIQYRPAGELSFITLNGIFEEDWTHVDPDTEIPVASNQPRVGIKLADLGGVVPKKGDRVVVRDLNYKVIEPRDDSQGGYMLFLHKIGSSKA